MLPNNINDLISAARDGELGLIEEGKIGDLTIDALSSLDDPVSLNITRKPIQNGTVMTDAAVEELQPVVMGIVLTNPQYGAETIASAAAAGELGRLNETWRDKKRRLYEYFDSKEVIDVQTHEDIYPSCLIQNITPYRDAEENLDCFIASVVLERINYYGQEETQSDNKIAAVKQNVGNL
jgi:hypothetical protein